MKNTRKRFTEWISNTNGKKFGYRIFLRNGIEETTEVRFDNPKEVIDWCLGNSERCLLENYMVQCLVDGVKIRTDDILHFWERSSNERRKMRETPSDYYTKFWNHMTNLNKIYSCNGDIPIRTKQSDFLEKAKKNFIKHG